MGFEWNITQSEESKRVCNPIRNVSDRARPSPSSKSIIKLSIGDPTLDGNLLTPPAHTAAVQKAAGSNKYNGYAPSNGLKEAREAAAEFWRRNFVTTEERKSHIHGDNVVITSGGSHAILMAIKAVCNPGDNVIVPRPGFCHYQACCDAFNIGIKYYDLDSDNYWEADIKQIESLRDEKTKLFIMTNPSNPCGSNFSRQHVEALVQTAARLKLPMLSDEIYAGMVFQNAENPNKEFTSVADIDADCPRVILGGTAKSFVVPGWRVAWLLLVDPKGVGQAYLHGALQEAMLIVGANNLAQAALPSALLETPPSYLPDLVSSIEAGAFAVYKAINAGAQFPSPDGSGKVKMLAATMPQGAMYVMVRIFFDQFDPEVVHDDESFFSKLLEEENVMVIPGGAFNSPNYFRVVVTRPVPILEEGVARIIEFCKRHQRK